MAGSIKSENFHYGALANDGYRPRLVERLLLEGLEDSGGVCIEGVKYCGKTWCAQAFAASEMNLTDPAGNFQNLEIAAADPFTALAGTSPRLIDEWQEVPQLWDGVRNVIDRSGKTRSFILTGSSVPRQKNKQAGVPEKPLHSGIGRIERLRMRPCSLFESGESNGAVSLASLFAGKAPSAQAPSMSLAQLCALSARGGWPAFIGKEPRRAQRMLRGYINDLCERDMSRVDGVRRDAAKVRRLLQSLARNAEQATKSKTLIADMTETPTEARLAAETVEDYLQTLKKLFVLEEIPPFSQELRSRLRINKRPKYHMVDPSFIVSLLRASQASLAHDLETFGFVFECLCMRDLLVYAQAIDARVFYYRDQTGLEADAIIESAGGDWAAIEVKLGHHKADEGAAHLKELGRRIVAAGGREPAFLAVLEGLGGYAYRRDDGVCVVPICTLTA